MVAIEDKFLPQLVSLENSVQAQVNGILFALRDQIETHCYPAMEWTQGLDLIPVLIHSAHPYSRSRCGT